MKKKIKKVSVRETRANLADVLGAVYYGHEIIIIQKKGRPFAVLINPDDFSKLNKGRKSSPLSS